jgi:hypothetical protein
MPGETNLNKLLRSLNPVLNPGEYVFCVAENLHLLDSNDLVMTFREKEGSTVILRKELANKLTLKYDFVASWITLEVHSSLAAVGLTARFSAVLASAGISCNVVAGYYHDHIFVPITEAIKALQLMKSLIE